MKRRAPLASTLSREGLKARIRIAMVEARARGKAPEDFGIEDLEPGLPALIEEVRAEVLERDVLGSAEGKRPMPAANTRIDALYAEIRSLVSRSAADPSLRGELDSRMRELRRLQEQEAAEIGRRYEASLSFKPGSLHELLERAHQALGDA
jgi:hypothetical protein